MAEIYVPDDGAWDEFARRLEPDGIEKWLDLSGLVLRRARTEMIGIP